MIVTLTDSEWVIAAHIAELRQAQNGKAGVTDQRQSSAVDEIVANYARELAVCKFLNFYPDLEFLRPGNEDCVYRGRLIDVKKAADKMNVRVKPGKKSDLYIGCNWVPAHRHFVIVGFIWHTKMQQMRQCRKENGDGTHYYSIPVHRLIPISKIDDCCDWLDRNGVTS